MIPNDNHYFWSKVKTLSVSAAFSLVLFRLQSIKLQRFDVNAIVKRTVSDMFTDRKEWTSELTSDTFPQQSVSANKLLCRRYPLILLMPWSLVHYCILTFYQPPLPSSLLSEPVITNQLLQETSQEISFFCRISSGGGLGGERSVWL